MRNRLSFFFFFLLTVISCESLIADKEGGAILCVTNPIAVRSGSDINSLDLFFVSQKMAELFVSSQKDALSIVSIEPYDIDGITCFYVINLEKGYKIVSADTRVQPVLAECEDGFLSLDKTENSGIKVWLEDTADRIRILKTYNPVVKEDYSDLWLPFRSNEGVVSTRSFDVDSIWIRVVESSVQTIYSHANQPALMTTKWGQGAPWNVKMPTDYYSGNRCATGCAAVAVAQVLRYFNKRGNYPTDLWHNVDVQSATPCSYPYLGYVTTTLSKSGYTSNSSRWSQMPDTKTGSNTKYVSRLMLDVGNRIDMHYSEQNSFVFADTLQYSIPNLSSCGISSWFAPYDFSLVAANINMEWPVIISAFYNPTFHMGHVWIIDGCHDYSKDYLTTETYYCIHPDTIYGYSNVVSVYSYDEMININPDIYDGMQTVTCTNHTERDLHMNWGWDGENDGYYNLIDSDDWIVQNNGSSLNFLYTRNMHYHLSTSQLN